MREKIRTYDEDYEKLIIDIRSNQIQVESLQKEFLKVTKDISRNAYVKRINDVNTNFNKQKNEFGKVNQKTFCKNFFFNAILKINNLERSMLSSRTLRARCSSIYQP